MRNVSSNIFHKFIYNDYIFIILVQDSLQLQFSTLIAIQIENKKGQNVGRIFQLH